MRESSERPTTPGRTEPDAAAEIQDSNHWLVPGGSHFIIVEYLGRKLVYEFTTEGRVVYTNSPGYPVMNSYTEQISVVNIVGDFSLFQSNESIWETLIEIPTSQVRWAFAEVLYSIVPGGASATDIAEGRYGMAGVHFAQDVAETILIFGKLSKLSKFSKLSRLATLGDRFAKNSKAAFAAIAVTELIGAGASGIQAGKDLANGERKLAAINAFRHCSVSSDLGHRLVPILRPLKRPQRPREPLPGTPGSWKSGHWTLLNILEWECCHLANIEENSF